MGIAVRSAMPNDASSTPSKLLRVPRVPRTRLARAARVGPLPLVALALALLVPACASTTTTPRMRVARDLGCTAERTTVERVDPSSHRWNVSGCGRHAVYVCTEPVRDCWREGDVHAAP